VRFLLDHDVPDDAARLLRHWGHEVTVLRDVLSITTPDDQIFDYICQNQLIVVTCNRNHFLALARGATVHPGVVILIRRRSRQLECAQLHRLLIRAGEAGLKNNINFA
jgi:predicted nuclease of predicted toxin-antitoxin system